MSGEAHGPARQSPVVGTVTITVRTLGDVARYLRGCEAAEKFALAVRRLTLASPQAALELHRLGVKGWHLDLVHATEQARVRRRLKRQLAVSGTRRRERGTARRGGASARRSSRARRGARR